MFTVPLNNPHLKRTLRPKYAQHQATPQAGFFDPEWDGDYDIYPGSVISRAGGELFTPYTGATGQKPWGLSALFIAPRLGVDEMTDTGSNLFSVWVGGDDAEFEILAPAFDEEADWTVPEDGSTQLLTGNEQSLLTTEGATPANSIAELVDVIGTHAIVVRPHRPTA